MVRRIEKGRDSLAVRRLDKGTVLIKVLLPLCE